jgi:ATP-dependent helicase/nuclease subunit A
MDLERFSLGDADKEVDALVKDGFISEDDRKRVEAEEINAFGRSDLYREMLDAHTRGRRIMREFRFSVMLPAPLFATKPAAKESFKDEEILLQGVIDCIYEDKDGNLHLVDYKTDRLKKDELEDKSKAKAILNKSHSRQLTYYAIAIKKMLGVMPKTVRVYSLHLGDTVDIDLGGEAEEFKAYEKA